jgi:hypothetical protein
VTDEQLTAEFEEQRPHLRGRLASGKRTYAVMGFTVADGKIVAIDILADPAAGSRLSARSLSGAQVKWDNSRRSSGKARARRRPSLPHVAHC